jgi:hypothetical protein
MTTTEFENLQLEKLATFQDWNKKWPDAKRMAPVICADCGARLEKPKAKPERLMPNSKAFPQGLHTTANVHIRIDCQCGVCYVWNHPNIYLKTHRFLEMAMHRFADGTLLKPKAL